MPLTARIQGSAFSATMALLVTPDTDCRETSKERVEQAKGTLPNISTPTGSWTEPRREMRPIVTAETTSMYEDLTEAEVEIRALVAEGRAAGYEEGYEDGRNAVPRID